VAFCPSLLLVEESSSKKKGAIFRQQGQRQLLAASNWEGPVRQSGIEERITRIDEEETCVQKLRPAGRRTVAHQEDGADTTNDDDDVAWKEY